MEHLLVARDSIAAGKFDLAKSALRTASRQQSRSAEEKISHALLVTELHIKQNMPWLDAGGMCSAATVHDDLNKASAFILKLRDVWKLAESNEDISRIKEQILRCGGFFERGLFILSGGLPVVGVNLRIRKALDIYRALRAEYEYKQKQDNQKQDT